MKYPQVSTDDKEERTDEESDEDTNVGKTNIFEL